MTGFYRDGFCRTGPEDVGLHTVCVKVTREFLDFSVLDGNDLVTPRPEWGFPGLEPGEWAVAAQLVPLVLRHRLQGQPTWEFTRRILVDEHFEFRGGRPRDRSWSGILSRVDDA